jgi:hypothetical protein
MRTKTFVAVLIALLAFAVVASAAPNMIPANEKARSRANADKAPVIEKVDEHWILKPSGLERYAFVHYKKGFAKPPWAGGGKTKENKCYEFLGRGVQWKQLPVNYVIDPTYSGLPVSEVDDATWLAVSEWDDFTGADLFGPGGVVYDGSWDDDMPDGRNELVFADYNEPNVIAVAITWGYFSGPPSKRRIVEFDILFDTDYNWGYAGDTNEVDLGDPNFMDLQNIATHELGHGIGLDDQTDENACSEVTMFGESQEGETKKRTLEPPDIKGLQKLYGE